MIEIIETPALHRLEGYLDAVGDLLRTGELRWYFEVKLLTFDSVPVELNQVIESAYPQAKLQTSSTSEISLSIMVETIERELGRFVPEIRRLMMLTPISSGTSAMWEHLMECVNYKQAKICEYSNSESDSLLHGLMGDFAFILCDESRQRSLILSGVTSD